MTRDINSMTPGELRQALRSANETIESLVQQIKDSQESPRSRSPESGSLTLAAWNKRLAGRVKLFDLREVQ